MSVVASFVLECARSGRWVRGILALQGNLNSTEVDVSRARIQLASRIFEKQWRTALDMVRTSDVSHVDEMSNFLYECSKSAYVPSDVFNNVAITLLQSAKDNDEIQNQLFRSVVKWTTWSQALELFTHVKLPNEKSLIELDEWLKCSRMFGSINKKRTIDSALMQLNLPDSRGNNLKTKGHSLNKKNVSVVRKEIKGQTELTDVLGALKSGKHLSMVSLVKLAKLATTEGCVSWKLPLSLVMKHRIVDDCNDVFAKMVGVCSPQLWQVALNNFSLNGKIALWLASSQNWKAALIVSQSVLLSDREKYDILSRSLTPTTQLRKVLPPTRATERVYEPTKKAIASMLASGYLLEELQLSAFAKSCQRNGDWESALYLFNRIGTEEFQQRAIKTLLEHSPNVKMEQILGLVDYRKPANTSTASMLIKNSSDWLQALFVFHYILSRGTQCNPQILSALMDAKPPIGVLSTVIEKLKWTANDGILRRMEYLKKNSSETS
ncbi:uncharacterized protein TM35_000122040 [Trypanosoma theileri]|uniref:Uncharacterized protein n=1 Tax=Trypanosoma theileri TaxID=67003 RepID=A0A1X0NYZ1_9TRYP|nr:uncharacterized protein TM35_000122040 [Trypanosoma theileri]ORC89429.1 hypothetical protein TM35_000122040 [Trypanosoma theileri]